jgi:hypothetical protein
MTTVNDNYPKTEVSDAHLKELALQNYQTQQVRQHNFPTEVISLPSQGKVYPEGSPLSSGKVEMKYMTAREEDILTSANLIRQGVVLDKLFQSMIVSPVNYNDIIIGDKNAVMIAARILGYGKDYDVKVTCPLCERTTECRVDLTTVKEKEISLTEDVVMKEPNRFEMQLPHSKRIVVFRLMSHGLDSKVEKILEQAKKVTKKDSVDTELTTRLKHLIVSIDGIEDQTYINNFVDTELMALDSRVLRAKIKEVSPDVPFKFDFECIHCGNEETLEFPITTDFFWPGA